MAFTGPSTIAGKPVRLITVRAIAVLPNPISSAKYTVLQSRQKATASSWYLCRVNVICHPSNV